MKYATITSTAAILSGLALTLSACGKETPDEPLNAPVESLQEPDRAIPPEPGTMPAPGPEARMGELIPPAPGEVGGLPDDREPLDESRIDPESIRGAGLVVEQYAMALEEGRYLDAFAQWGDEGAASGLTGDAFAQSLMKYEEIHVLIGRPAENGASDKAVVPVQMYGRMVGGSPFNTVGPVFLERGDTDGGAPWVITDSALKPAGTVEIAR